MSIASSPTPPSPLLAAAGGPGPSPSRRTSAESEGSQAAPPATPFLRGSSSSSGHYYVAVDQPHHKTGTLLDLLEVLARRGDAGVVVACRSRDVLDHLAAHLAAAPHTHLHTLHSDQSEAERAAVLAAFQQPQPPVFCSDSADVAPPDSARSGADMLEGEVAGSLQRCSAKVAVLLSTDACLPGVLTGEASAAARLLANYDIPSTKEVYMRRASAALRVSGGGLVVSFVAAPEVRSLRCLEEGLGFLLQEMPIHILELV